MKFQTVSGQELEKRVGKWEPPPLLWGTEDGKWFIFLGRQLSPELKEAKVVSVIYWPAVEAKTLYPYFVIPKQGSARARDDIARMTAFIVMQKLNEVINLSECQRLSSVEDVAVERLTRLAHQYGRIERDGGSTYCRLSINKVRKSNASHPVGGVETPAT